MTSKKLAQEMTLHRLGIDLQPEEIVFNALEGPFKSLKRSGEVIERSPQSSLTLNHWNHLSLAVARVHFSDETESPFNLEKMALTSYRSILDLVARRNLGSLIRVWNFIPEIHKSSGLGLERYRVFNKGRMAAWQEGLARNVLTQGFPPAATGIGKLSTAPEIEIFALIARGKALGIENSRQTPAFQYSTHYGPQPPLFSRALLHEIEGQKEMWISGTASIVGENTVHQGDLTYQILETLRNIQALTLTRSSLFDLKKVVVYLRRREDFANTIDFVGNVFSPHEIQYVQAEICRRDLLIEIEGTARL